MRLHQPTEKVVFKILKGEMNCLLIVLECAIQTSIFVIIVLYSSKIKILL